LVTIDIGKSFPCRAADYHALFQVGGLGIITFPRFFCDDGRGSPSKEEIAIDLPPYAAGEFH
jgi:hypothetical protein